MQDGWNRNENAKPFHWVNPRQTFSSSPISSAVTGRKRLMVRTRQEAVCCEGKSISETGLARCPWACATLHTAVDNVAHGRGQRATRLSVATRKHKALKTCVSVLPARDAVQTVQNGGLRRRLGLLHSKCDKKSVPIARRLATFATHETPQPGYCSIGFGTRSPEARRRATASRHAAVCWIFYPSLPCKAYGERCFCNPHRSLRG